MTTAEDARKLKGWILENAGLEAQSLPMVVRALWMMDSERWEAFQQEHTPNNLEEGVELVLSYLEATINGTAAQPKREAQKNKEVKDWEEECRLRARHPRRCNKPSPGCLLCDQDHLFANCPFRSYEEEPECPQPKGEEPEHPQPKREEPERPARRYHPCADSGGAKMNTRFPPKRVPSAARFFTLCRLTVQPPQSYSVGGQRSSGQLTGKPAGARPDYRGRWCAV
ncbi:UNVERIFIED_CONTAM: hypothetical protein FKN15_053522 [Acipenser sinensis]